MSGRLTTHVLDLSRGRPAAGLALQLWRLSAGLGTSELLQAVVTNSDGRLDAPLLEGAALEPGCYELLFMAGAYFRSNHSEAGTEADGSFFLDQIPIRFNIISATDHYHIPLLVAPGGYSTYRGS